MNDKLKRYVNALIDSRADNVVHRIPGKVLSVTDGCRRADVELIGSGQPLKNLLNKSGEKLKEGQSVWIEYMTLPSSGWIAMTNGEADPLHEGGDGGDEYEVEYAALLDAEGLHEFVADEEIMAGIDGSTRLYYGAVPTLAIVQHQPVYLGTGDFDEMLPIILANRGKFATDCRFTSYYRSSATVYQEYEIYFAARLTSYQVNANHSVAIQIGHFKQITTTRYSNGIADNPTTATQVSYISKTIPDAADAAIDFFTVPISGTIGGAVPYDDLADEIPYGYVGSNSTSGLASASYTSGSGLGAMVFLDVNGCDRVNSGNYRIPLGALTPLSEPETWFSLGVAQRSEPVKRSGD